MSTGIEDYQVRIKFVATNMNVSYSDINELQDRQSRENNIIIFNVPESYNVADDTLA